MTEQLTNGLDDVQLHLVDDVATAQEFLRWAGERRPHDAIAIDIETGERPGHDTKDALSPWRGQIRLMQVGDGMQSWAIPWVEWAGVFYQMMNSYTGKIVAHNIAFESKWMALQSRWTMPWERMHDTMIMSQVINPLQSAALKTLSAQMVDGKSAALQGTLNKAFSENGWTWGTVPITFQPYWAYGALDCVLTMRLFDKFWKDCGPGERYAVPYELEMATRKIATRMELNGAPVDLGYSQRKYDQLTTYTDRAKAWAKKEYGGLSITSNVQLVRQFEKMGAEITEVTATGNKSVTKDQLDIFVRDGAPDVRLLAETTLNQRKADKLAGSYFLNFLNGNIDGILHPSIKTLAARTGRMSITDPALQTLPSNDPVVRHAFIPRGEDEGIVSSDLDQVELRLMAAFSADKNLIDLFNEADRSGGDVFTSIMRDVYGDKSLVKADPRRKLIKSSVYGGLYGAGVAKRALTAGVSTAQMQVVVDAFDHNYPGVAGFQHKVEDIGMKRLRNEGEGYVVTSTGRRLPADGARIYALTNYMIQASAAEVFKQNLVKLDQADMTEFMIVPVHDEIVMSVPLKDCAEVIPIVKECMTTSEGWPIPLTADAGGPWKTWGDHYEK